MSDPLLKIQRQSQALDDQMERLRKADTLPLYLPWTHRIINPFPLASSGQGWGDSPQPWAVTLIRFTCSVFVTTTNDASNFWTIALVNAAGATLASFTTAAIGANSWERLSTTTITAPASTNKIFTIIPTATLSPGAIYIAPALALLRTGN